MNAFERDRVPIVDFVRGEASNAAHASEPATAGAPLSRLGPFVGLRRRTVVWGLVAAVLMFIVALLARELLIADSMTARRAEKFKSILSRIPPITGHWHLNGDVWQCQSGVGVDCH